MAILTDEIWSLVLAHPDTKLNPPAYSVRISRFEQEYNFRFPESHRAFLLRANGGEVGYIRLFTVGLARVLDMSQKVPEMLPYLETTAPGPILPFANTWGGSYYCYDLSNQSPDGEYPILFWDHEYSEEPDDLPMLWSEHSPNFVEFLRQVIS